MENNQNIYPQETPPTEKPFTEPAASAFTEVSPPTPATPEAIPQEEVLKGGLPDVKEGPVETVSPQPAAPVKPPVGQPHPKKGFWSQLLTWLIVALVFYIGGLATLYFALYKPEKTATAAAAAEMANTATSTTETDATKIATLTVEFDRAIQQYQDAQAQLDATKSELDAANATIAEQDAALKKTNQLNIAYKFLVDVSSARVALEKKDTTTALQAVNFAKADLKALEASGVQSDSFAGFSDKLNEASSNLTPTGLTKSRAALDTLYANLLLLVDNLP